MVDEWQIWIHPVVHRRRLMNSDNRNERVSPAETALRRAARGVLKEAVDSSAPIPVWNGTEVVWEVPTKQLE
jgi:hypothetical protein